MQAVILAGGKGTRLRPLTSNLPKPMVPLFGRPVLEHCISLLSKHGIDDIIITVSYLARDIMEYFGDGSRWGVKIRYSVESTPQGTAGGIKLLQKMINDTFVIVSGDAVTDFDLTAALQKHKAASAMASLLLYEVSDPTQFGLVGRDSSCKITRFLEKPKSSEVFTNTVNTGIYIMEPEVLSCIPHFIPCDFGKDIFPQMLNNGDPLYGFNMSGYWCDIGNLIQYSNVHYDALKGKIKLDIPATHVGNGVWIGENADIDPSIELTSPLFIGSGAILKKGVILRGRAIIGADAVVDEDAVIHRSVIGNGSFISKGTNVSDCIITGGYATKEGETLADQALVGNAKYQPAIPRPSKTLPSKPHITAIPRETQQTVSIEQLAA